MHQFLKRAIHLHTQWKINLLTEINTGKIIDRHTCCSDSHCELGQWINTNYEAFYGNPEFEKLKQSHKQFHESVGKIIDLIDSGNIIDAKMEIHSGSFAQYSKETILDIINMRSVVSPEQEIYSKQIQIPSTSANLSTSS